MQAGFTPRAFSLLELLVVLAVIALVTALVAPAAARAVRGDQERDAVVELVEFLAGRRLEAVRTGSATLVAFSRPDAAVLAVDSGDRARRWTGRRLLGVGDDGRVLDDAQVMFTPSGRATRAALRFVTQPSGRMWLVEFDPLTGAPSARKSGG